MGGSFPYELIRSSRKTLAVQITSDGRVVVRAPNRLSRREIQRFLDSRKDWIMSHLARAKSRQPEQKLTEEQVQKLAQEAQVWFPAAVAKWEARMGVTCTGITIRCQKTRWGSCSSAGRMNFNCLLMLAPEWVREYVVVHELCHRIEMNHSPAFWALVARELPDYRQAVAWLKNEGKTIMAMR